MSAFHIVELWLCNEFGDSEEKEDTVAKVCEDKNILWCPF